MALRAGFDPARIYLHGNNKTERELREALECGVGHVICDSFDEIARLDELAAAAAGRADPGHPRHRARRPTPPCRPAGSTRSSDSGSTTASRRRRSERVRASRNLDLVGLHAHIGSQILELEPYVEAIEALGELADPDWCRIAERRRRARHRLYRRTTIPRRSTTYADVKVQGARGASARMPRILVEPGRSLVGNAGSRRIRSAP